MQLQYVLLRLIERLIKKIFEFLRKILKILASKKGDYMKFSNELNLRFIF